MVLYIKKIKLYIYIYITILKIEIKFENICGSDGVGPDGIPSFRFPCPLNINHIFYR